MTQEDKDLLLKDLCGRLSYGIICYDSDNQITFTIDDLDDISSRCPITNYGNSCTAYCKPYLRPMSSMTEEERKEYREIEEVPDAMDYLLSHHFDCRYLIDMGLAIEVLERMYNNTKY